MAGHSSASAPTRYAGIQVQTSSLGVTVPIVWGTARCKCNLVWYNNFQSKAQKAASGKGGATVTGYSYSADIILAICEGPISAIKTIYVDSKVYTNGAKTALAQVGLSMATGAVGQAVWSYLSSKYPNQALGYSGLCIAYASSYPLDTGAGTPQHNFEVISNFTVSGLPDANPHDVITDFLTNSRYGLPNWGTGLIDSITFGAYSTYCLAANLLISPVIDQARQASDFLKEIMMVTNSNLLWSEGLLKAVVYGDTQVTGNSTTFTPNLTPVYALTDDHFIPRADGDDPVHVEIEDQSDAYNIVQVEYLDRTNQYSTAIATANDAANITQFGRRKQDPTSLHSICDATVAQNVAQVLLQRTLYVRKQFKFTLSWQFALLEPGDIVTLTHPAMGLAAYAVRIIQIDEDEDGALELTAEDLLAGVSHAPLYPTQAPSGYLINQSIDPGGVEANLLTWSQDWTQSPWGKTNITVTAAAGTDPVVGATAAQKLAATTTNGQHYVAEGFTAFAGANYTFSVYVGGAGRKNVRVQLASTTSAAQAQIGIDLSTGGVFLAAYADGGATLVGSSVSGPIVDGSENWYRISISAVLASDTAINAAIGINADSDLTSGAPWAGDGTTGVLVYGAQLTQGVDIRTYAATTTAALGPLLFNPPVVLTVGAVEVWAAAAGGPNWGGANVWTSIDGTDYEFVGVISAPARYGVATTALASHSDPDTTDSVGVDISASSGALTSASQATADNGGTLCLLGSELICFETATLTAPSQYTLGTYLRRGFLNSTIASHTVGETFIRLDQAIYALPYNAPNIGTNAYVKFQSFNLWGQSATPLSNCIPYRILPLPIAATAPAAGDWSAVGTTLSN